MAAITTIDVKGYKLYRSGATVGSMSAKPVSVCDKRMFVSYLKSQTSGSLALLFKRIDSCKTFPHCDIKSLHTNLKQK